MLVDIPKDVQFATAAYTPPEEARVLHYQPRTKGDADAILAAVEALEKAERPVLYFGGGVINSGREASGSCASSPTRPASRSPRR